MLSGIRVIDLTSALGAFAGRMFSQLGAEVIKVESTDGDPQRAEAAVFAAWNFSKRSVVADLHSDAFTTLMKSTDIVIRNPGIAHDFLLGLQPKLIDVVIAPFLPGSADDDAPYSDFTLMARSGLMTIIGDPDRPPMTLPGEQAFALGAIQAVTGALTALHARDMGLIDNQLVEVSAYQSAVLANYREPLTWAWAGRTGNRTGNLLVRGKSGVRQVWPCEDGYVTWALVDNPPMMRAMVALMGTDAGPMADIDWKQTLVADLPRAQLEEWESRVAAFFMTKTKAWLGAQSASLGLGLSWIDAPLDVLFSDQHAARHLWVDVDGMRYPGPLWTSSLDSLAISNTVPELGEANHSLCGGKYD